MCHRVGGGVLGRLRQQRGVQLWRLPAIIKRPEESEGERHGKDLSHADGHAQETQRLQLLSPTNKTVYLWTAALKHRTVRTSELSEPSEHQNHETIGGLMESAADERSSDTLSLLN